MTEKPSIRSGGTNRLDLAAEGSNALVVATGKAPAASPEKWDESQIEGFISTYYDPIITAAYNDNDGKGVYFVARWKAVANGLLADGETRKDAVRALLDATSDWLGVFVRTSGEPAASPEPVAWEMWRDGERVYTAVLRRDMVRSMEQGYEAKPLAYAEPTPNSAAESALLKALEKIIAEVSERRVGHREKIVEIARTAIDQAREG